MDERHAVHALLEAVGAATLIVIGFWLLERQLGWDPVSYAERLLDLEAERGEG